MDTKSMTLLTLAFTTLFGSVHAYRSILQQELISHMQAKSSEEEVIPIVDRALAAGVNVNYTCFESPHALSIAAMAGWVVVIQKLVEEGAWLFANMYEQHAPLHKAAYVGQVSSIETLVRLGADIDEKDRLSRTTPLHMAVMWGQVAATEKLMALGASPSERDTYGQTPLDYIRDGAEVAKGNHLSTGRLSANRAELAAVFGLAL